MRIVIVSYLLVFLVLIKWRKHKRCVRTVVSVWLSRVRQSEGQSVTVNASRAEEKVSGEVSV